MKKIVAISLLISSLVAIPVYAEEETESTLEPTIETEIIEPTTEVITEPTTEPEEILENSGSAEGEGKKEKPTEPAMTDGAVSENDFIIPNVVNNNTNNIDDMEEEKKKLEEESRKQEEDMKAKQEELSSLNNELSSALAKIHELDTQASELSSKIYETEQNLKKANEEKEVQYGDMKKRIQYMYESENTSFVEAILSSKDMTEALNAADYYQQIYNYDREKLEDFKVIMDNILALENEQKQELEEIEKLKTENEIEKAKLEVFIAEKQGDIDSLTKAIQENAEGIEKLDQNILNALSRMASEASARAQYQGNTEALLKIAEAAQEQALKDGTANAKMVAVARNAGRGISTFPLTYGWCAAWVSGVYNITGGIHPPSGNAIDYWNKWKSSGSTRMDNVPIGACVISSGDPTYGHIGIYLGGGIVASNLGYCKVETIESFGSVPAVCQGHRGYIGWVWPNGQSLM